jgi:hypothetical protein
MKRSAILFVVLAAAFGLSQEPETGVFSAAADPRVEAYAWAW